MVKSQLSWIIVIVIVILLVWWVTSCKSEGLHNLPSRPRHYSKKLCDKCLKSCEEETHQSKQNCMISCGRVCAHPPPIRPCMECGYPGGPSKKWCKEHCRYLEDSDQKALGDSINQSYEECIKNCLNKGNHLSICKGLCFPLVPPSPPYHHPHFHGLHTP